MKKLKRCAWVGDDPLYINYHDNEWGIPEKDDKKLFEMLILETQQAGLSWITVLRKREAYREAFDNFNPEKIAKYDDKKYNQLLNNPDIIRNKLKIKSIINNSKVYLELIKTTSLSDFLWAYVDNLPIINNYKSEDEIPSQTDLSIKISKDMKKLGFSFVGPTTIYAYIQAIGMVNDHFQCDFK